MKKINSLLLLFASLISVLSAFSACDKKGNQKEEYTTRSQTVSYAHFNTVTILSSYGAATAEEFAAYVKTVDEMLGHYHKLFDIYYEYAGVNNIKTINKNAGKEPVAVEEELIVFLEYCKELYAVTKGQTNILFGSVLKLWHDARETYNNSVRRLAKRWSNYVRLCEFDKKIGFSKSTPDPKTGQQVSVSFAHPDANSCEIINGVTYGWHPKRGVDSPIQRRMAKIFAELI